MPRSVVDGQSVGEAIANAGGFDPDPFAGNGGLGNTTISSIVNTSGVQNYANLTIQTAARLAAIAGEKLQVRVKGDLVIQGTGKIHANGRGSSGVAGGKGGTGGTVPGEGLTQGSGSAANPEMLVIVAGGGGGGGGSGNGPSLDGAIGGPGSYRFIVALILGGAAGNGGTIVSPSGIMGGTTAPLDAGSRAELVTNLGSGFRQARNFFSRFTAVGGAGGSGGGASGGSTASPGGPSPGSFAGGNGGLPNINEDGDGGVGGFGGNYSTFSPGGGGGASGSSGGWLLVEVAGDVTLDPGSRISANGGAGGAGGAAGTASVPGAGGGGGGGGGGGVVAIFYHGNPTNLDGVTVTATGGTGGASGGGPSAIGGSGGNGEAGYTVIQQV